MLSPPLFTSTQNSQKSPLRAHTNIDDLKKELFDTVFASLQNSIEDVINNALNDLKTELNSVKEAQIIEISNHENLIKENERLKTLIKQQDEVIQCYNERLKQECCSHKHQQKN